MFKDVHQGLPEYGDTQFRQNPAIPISTHDVGHTSDIGDKDGYAFGNGRKQKTALGDIPIRKYHQITGMKAGQEVHDIKFTVDELHLRPVGQKLFPINVSLACDEKVGLFVTEGLFLHYVIRILEFSSACRMT